MKNPVLTEREWECIKAYAEADMSATKAAANTHFHRNTLVYHLCNARKRTGLDPLNFYDLAHLLGLGDNPHHVPQNERRRIYCEAIEKYGEEHQCNKFDEELGEFLTEYGRIRNGANNLAAFAEELADLTIMLEQLAMIYGVEDEMAEQMDYKVRRLHGRIMGKGDED